MKRLVLLSLYALSLGVTPVLARAEYRLGGADGNPWDVALSDGQAGEYLVFDAGGQLADNVPVGTTLYGAGTDTMLEITATSIGPRLIEENRNLVWSDLAEGGIPLPYVGGKAQTITACSHLIGGIGQIKLMFDGDPSTTTFHRGYLETAHGGVWVGTTAVDFGAAIPVNRIRFYPRLGQVDDIRRIEAFTEPRHPVESFARDSFIENALQGYEIRVQDNSAPIHVSGPCDNPPRAYSAHPDWVLVGDEKLDLLKRNDENLDVVVDLHFPKRSVRWLTFQPITTYSWEVAEFEVYGGGYVTETVLLTQILDFGKPVNWGRIRWSGDFPEGTRVDVYTRTGNTVDPNLYFETDANGNVVPTTKERWEDLNFLVQLRPVYDTANWTFWSTPYDFEAGRRDPSLPAEQWQDGTPIISEGVGRYLQLRIRLFATFEEAPRLDQLSIQFSETPVARHIMAEVWPIEVTSSEPATFTYVVLPTFEPDNTGFDHLEILTHTRPQVRSLSVAGEEIDLAVYEPRIAPDEDGQYRATLEFPPVTSDKIGERVEVVFDAPVLRYGTQFTGWVWDGQDPEFIKQRVRPGNATYRFSGDVLSVRTPIGEDLLVDVTASPNPFTPNGDGVNDQLTLSYKLREVTALRAVSVQIYDLGGRLVRELSTPSLSGERQQVWNGCDGAGRLVPPGTYLYRLSLGTERQNDRSGIIGVAY